MTAANLPLRRSLYLRGDKVKKYKEKIVRCPKCRKEIGTYYDRYKSDQTTFSCWACKKLIIYHRDDETLEIKKMATRSTSSGMRFC